MRYNDIIAVKDLMSLFTSSINDARQITFLNPFGRSPFCTQKPASLED